MILEGTTSSGAVVPVEVTADGRVVAEGLQGPAGPAGPEGPEGPPGPGGDQWSIENGRLVPSQGEDVGLQNLIFQDDFSDFGSITGAVDGTGGTVVLSTTAPGAGSPTERMRITSGGSVLIADTALRDTTGQAFQVSGWGLFYQELSGTTASAFTHVGSGTQTLCVFRQGSPASTVGSISVSGGATTSYNTSSDYRLKENISLVTDGITRLKRLKPSRFNFIANPGVTVDGFIAHEVQGVIPEAITGEKDAVDEDGNPIYQAIDQSKLVPLLTAALQEAIREVESLKTRVTALEKS